MDKLLDIVVALVSLVSPEKIQAIAAKVRRTEVCVATAILPDLAGTPVARSVLEQLAVAWQSTEVGSVELASMLIAASHAHTKAMSEQSTELVWTGPTTPFVSARRTEQALLQVIHSANKRLSLSSFVAYDVSTIVSALNAAVERGVTVSMLLELSQEQGGSISFDVIAKMRILVPGAQIYAWTQKVGDFSEGSVHAKVAVADDKMCFITSANLTGHAMEKNMEAGVLITGGSIPALLADHMQSMVEMKVISPV